MSLIWRGDLPVSAEFDDPYYNQANGLAETRHVFLNGTDLPNRIRQLKNPVVAELGFGTGLNFLATWHLLQAAGVTNAQFISIEKYPLPATDIAKALAAFPELTDLTTVFLQVYTPTGGTFQLDDITLSLHTGDVAAILPQLNFQAHAWFLDGFAPAKNPTMWTPDVLQAVSRLTAPGGIAATFTAARQVRDNLTAAGFRVERLPGYGQKRHMVRAIKPK